MSQPSYSRRLSFNERLYLAADRQRKGFAIQYLFEGSGSITQEELERAVSIAAAANPGARLRLSGSLGWTRWVSDAPVPPVRVLPEWAEDAPPPEALDRWLNPYTGPTCELLLAPGKICRIVFRCFHGVMDGRGLFLFAEDVFRALRGEKTLGAPATINDTEFLESLVGRRKRKAVKLDRRAPFGHSASRSSEVRWERFQVPGPIPAFLAKVAVLLAKEGRALHNRPTRIMIPVDVRNYQRDLLSTANLSYPLFLDIEADLTWQDFQKRILKALGSKQALVLDPLEELLLWVPLPLLDLVFWTWAFLQKRTGLFMYSALLAHMALPNADPVSAPQFRCQRISFVPPQSEFVAFCVSSVALGSSIDVVAYAPAYVAERSQIVELIAKLKAALTSV